MKFESKFGIGEIVIRESHQNGKMVQERMLEVTGIIFEKNGIAYICEDTKNGHRMPYAEDMLVGDPDFDQDKGEYPVAILNGDTNREEN